MIGCDIAITLLWTQIATAVPFSYTETCHSKLTLNEAGHHKTAAQRDVRFKTDYDNTISCDYK